MKIPCTWCHTLVSFTSDTHTVNTVATEACRELSCATAPLETAPISPADKEKIAHGNAEQVLKLSPS